MDQMNEFGHDEMLNCPKCGFQQPRDQYCAKCGVDIFKAAQPRLKLSPILITSIAFVAASITWFVSSKRVPPPTNSNSLSSTGAAVGQARKTQGPTSRSSSPDLSANGELTEIANSSASFRNEVSENPPSVEHQDQAEQEPPHQKNLASQHSLKKQLNPELRRQIDSATSAGAKKNAPSEPGAEILVAFAWAEVSRELLQTWQAAEPGFHQIAGLDNRLRQSAGSFQILDVMRRRMRDDSEAVLLSKGDFSLYFEPMKANTREFVGGYTVQYRGTQGEPRSPASASANISFGSGALVNMGPSPSNSQNAVVVLVMPRWQK
jgi:hypothetical protein